MMSEMRRIIEAPVMDKIEEVDKPSRLFLSPSAYSNGRRLLPAQANAFVQFALSMREKRPGMFAPLGVGQGKTLTTLAVAAMGLSPDSFSLTKGCDKIGERALLVIPPNLHAQLMGHDIRWARTMMPLPYPIFDLTGKKRAAIATAKKPGLYVITYSRLSQPDGEVLLTACDPDLVICDEAHNLANEDAARTQRFLRFLRSRRRAFVPLSGTMTRKALSDYAHLARFSLLNHAFLPHDWNELKFWMAAIKADDADESPFDPTNMSLSDAELDTFRPLVNFAAKLDPSILKGTVKDAIRKSFNIRRRTMPGVIDSSEQDIGTSLTFALEKSNPWLPGTVVGEKIAVLDSEWIAPNGDEIDFALTKFKWHSELNLGWYNDLVWPDHPDTPKAKELHALGQEYHKALRKFLSHSRAGLDTPMLVGRHFHQHGGGISPELYDLWKPYHDMKKVGEKEKWPDRIAVPIRLSDEKLRHAITIVREWDLKRNPGIVWFHHNEVGRWITELLRAEGFRVIHAPAGADKMILDPENQKPGSIVVASILAHGTGKNLQAFRHNLFLEGFLSAVVGEQAIGRSHRTGQTADELVMQLLHGTEHDDLRLAACLNDSFYIHETMGRQKLIYGSWQEIPKIFSSTDLKAKGAAVSSVLDKRQQQQLEERFT